MRILIADDHAVVREGLKEILAQEFPKAVFGEAGNSAETLEKIRQDAWDVVVLDISMPGRSGLDVLHELKDAHSELPVLVLSMYGEDEYAVRTLKAGAAGYLTKESAPDDLVGAVKKVLTGGKYVSGSLAERLACDLEAGAEEAPHELLSDREYEVMRMIASGKTVTEIGKKLSLSVKTISTYRRRILEKMRLKSNAELAQYAIARELPV